MDVSIMLLRFCIVLLYLHQEGIKFLYLGSKFIAFTTRLPCYFLRPSLCLKKIENKIPPQVVDFIKADTHYFMELFKKKKNRSEDDEDYQLVFEGFGEAPYKIYLFVPPQQKSASDLTEPDMKMWGVHFQMANPMHITPCQIHDSHLHMLPFYLNNNELLDYYSDAMEDGMEKELIGDDYLQLKQIKEGRAPTAHWGTKFFCLGLPFTEMEYKEDVLAARLYHSIKDGLPTDITLFPAYEYFNNFGLLQEVFSSVSSSKYYFIRAVPDLMFSHTVSPTGTTEVQSTNPLEIPPTTPTVTPPLEISEAASANSMVLLCDERECLLEIKYGGRHTHSKLSEIPNAYAQVVGGLHSLAAAKVIKSLKHGNMLKEVIVKGLLINRKASMTLITLKAGIASVENAYLKVECCRIRFHDSQLTLALVCKGIQKLTE